MNPAEIVFILTTYFSLAIVFSLFALFLKLFQSLMNKSKAPLKFRWLAKTCNFLSVFAIAVVILAEALPRQALLTPKAQVFSESKKNGEKPFVVIRAVEAASMSHNEANSNRFSLAEKHLYWILCILLLGIVIRVSYFVFHLFKLSQFLSKQITIREIGKVQFLTGEEISFPFSFWILRKAYVVFPSLILLDSSSFSAAMKHELEHLRNKDAVWVYFYEFLKALFFWNPLVFVLVHQINEIQEFACDEVLVGRQKVSPQAYGRCLLKTAQNVVTLQPTLVGTTNMAVSRNCIQLKRRIEMLFEYKNRKSQLRFLGAFVIGTVMLMSSAGFAAKSMLQRGKLSMEEATRLAEKTASTTTIPIEMNELVLEKLNMLVATREGRSRTKAAFERLPLYKALIDQKTKEYGVPEETIAMAIAESGLKNGVKSSMSAAGIWQFIPGTARRYDLIVNKHLDERFEPEKETVAAMRYLTDLYNEFKDWRLAMKAYNIGENALRKLIAKHGTKDIWLFEKNSPDQEQYVSTVIAHIIVYKNPSLLN